ncbi:MAG: hypothetical protein HY928_12035, partial [Elusimicrobia bacterium]|nr:hypothetical protein [Elusimicrobiota bacterium]
GMTSDALSSNLKDTYIGQVSGGNVTAWVRGPDLPVAASFAAAAGADGMILYGGGFLSDNSITDRTFTARVEGAGLSAWEEGPLAPYPAYRPGIAAENGRFFWAGGQRQGGAISNGLFTSAVNSGGVALATATADAFALPEGPHSARAEAADRAGNTAFSSATFYVDLTPPDTQLVVTAASRTVAGDLYVLGVPTVSFSVTDGPAGAASGRGQTLFAVDAGTEAPAGDFVGLPAGWSTLHFRSVDAVGNAEVAKSSVVKLDAAPPAAVTDLAGLALSTSAIRLTWTVPGDDGALGDIADGAAGIAFSQFEGQSTGGANELTASGSLRAGTRLSWTADGLSPDTLYYAATYTQDTAGNWSPASVPVAVRTLADDILPPRTGLVVTGPQVPGTPLFITPQTSLTLSATDDLLLEGDGAGVGVAGSAYSLDSASLFTDYQSSFSIAGQTAHDLRYFSTDRAGHVEEVKLASVAVDGTGPAVALGYQVPFRTWLGTTTVFVQGLGPLFISATDYPALAVGTSVVYLSVDGGQAEPSPSPFNLGVGLRSLAFWAVDRLGTQGSTVTASLKLDATPPSAALDLMMAALSSSTVTVSWTAPGDDGASGDIFDAAVSLGFGTDPGSLPPSLVLSSGALAVGARFTQVFSGLSPGTTYFAAVLTRDSAGNWSDPAGASARTFSVAVSADNVATLASPVPAEVTVVSSATEPQAYAVAIASQGLAPVGSVFYELTSGLEFSTAAPALISFIFDPALVDPASVRIYTYDLQAMQWVSDSIVNQTLIELSPTLYQISGEILHTSLYAPMVQDTAPPLTAFSVLGSSAMLEGRLFAVGGSSGVLTAQDLAPLGGTPSGVAATLYRGGAGPETAYNEPFALPEGDLEFFFHSTDFSANSEAEKHTAVFVDGSAPLLTASADITAGTLAITAEDSGAGLASLAVVLDGVVVPVEFASGAVSVSTTLVLAPGNHILHVAAADRLGLSSSLDRTYASDAVPPSVAFAFPRPDEPGLCRLAQGPVSVRGSVFDANLAAWNLNEGASLLGSGGVNVDGLLGIFDATGKTGPFTLTLSAADTAGQTASASLDLYAGQASKTLALGGKKALNKPRGVAWAPNRIYVADTGSDLVRVYDGAGNLISSFGDKRRSLKLNKPSGLAVDPSGNIFVADANNKRVVKLSPAGFLLQEFGGKRFLEKPVAVALTGGKVLVADAHSGEVVVFAESGTLLRRLALPLVVADTHDDEHDDDDEEEARPMAIAAEASGAFWVADSKGGRVLRYDADLNLVQTIPGFERPEGLAVSPSGACLAVVDAKAGRVRTFDAARGSELAVFGNDVLHKPAQAAFTADGQLLVANRNEDQVTGFGLPGTSILIALTQPKGGFRTSDASEPPSAEPVVARVGRVEGGFIEEPAGAAVEVPAGAVAQDLDISVAVAAEAGVAERAAQNLTAASAPREFGPHGQRFALPVTITLPYDPGLTSGLRPEELKIHYWNAEQGAWEALASRVDADARTVSAETLHFWLMTGYCG